MTTETIVDTGAAAAATAAAAAAANAKGTPWYGTPDTETLGYIQNRGLDKMTPDKAALEAIKAHREAEKLIGVPQDQLLRIPKDASDTAGWAKVREKLGTPADAKEYDYSAVKGKDGKTLTPEETESMRTIAAELKLPKNDAALLAQKLLQLADSSREASEAKAAGELAQEQDKLKQNWGFNAAANKLVAENAMRALGVKDEVIATLQKSIGYADTMEMFRNIGARIGEDKFITNVNPNGNSIMTKDAATYRLGQLQNDTVWYNRYLAGDASAAKEFNDLTQIVAGQ